MGTNQVQSLGALGRTDTFWFRPEQLIIVEDDPKHPLYDGRGADVREEMVRNVSVYGVLENVLVRRAGRREDGTPILEVVAGRKRVRAARLANERKIAAGEEPIRVPCTLKVGEDHTLFGVMVSENEHRTNTTPMQLARQLERYLAMGRSEEEAAVAFGVTPQTIRNRRALLDAAPVVQRAVEAGELPAMAAVDLSSLPRPKQEAALASMREAGATKGAAAREAAQRAREGKPATAEPKPKARPRKALERAVYDLQATRSLECSIAAAMLRWALGDDAALKRMPADVRNVLKG